MEQKKDLNNQEITDFLFKEKDTARQEVLVNIKIVSQVSLVLLPFFFAGIGLLLRYGDDGKDIKIIAGEKLPLLLILINQVMFLLWMYGLSIVSNLASLAGYIMALEEKINHFSGQEIAMWEGVIQHKYILKWKSGQVISTLFWNLFYFLMFVYITIYTYAYCKKQNWSFFVLNCAEILIIIFIFLLAIRTRKKSYELTRLKIEEE